MEQGSIKVSSLKQR